MLVLTSLFFAAGILFVALAIPLVRRRVAPNRLYGLRTQATLASKELWYEANATAAKQLMALGGLISACAVTLPVLVELSEGAYALAMCSVVVIGSAIVCVMGWRSAQRSG